MLKRIASGLSAIIVSLSSFIVFAPAIASAAVDVCTWDGSSSVNWNTAANWSCATDGAAVPGAGDSLVFPYGASVTNKALNNDISGGTYASITFSGAAATDEAAYSISGNAITVSTGITVSATSTSSQVSLKLDITASDNITINPGTTGLSLGDDDLSSTFALGAHDLTISYASSIYINSKLTGSGDIQSSTSTSLYGDNSGYSGTYSQASETVYVRSQDMSSSQMVIMDATSLVYLICDNQTATANITLEGTSSFSDYPKIELGNIDCPVSEESGGSGGGGGDDGPVYDEYYGARNFATAGNVTLAGTLTIDSDVEVGPSAKINKITSTIIGAHKISPIDGHPGTLVLESGNNGSTTANGSYMSPRKITTIEAASQTSATVYLYGNANLVMDGKRGDTTVTSDGKLSGTGTVGALTVEDTGIVAPGHSPGCLSSGNLTLAGIYEAEVNGADACTGYDQLKVTGTVNLTNGTLSLSMLNQKLTKNSSYTIIDNDAADKITGEFKNLKEGATFMANDYTMKISYVGGTGNDVTVKVLSLPGVPYTGFGMLLNNPAGILAAASLAAGAILIVSRKLKPATKRSRS